MVILYCAVLVDCITSWAGKKAAIGRVGEAGHEALLNFRSKRQRRNKRTSLDSLDALLADQAEVRATDHFLRLGQFFSTGKRHPLQARLSQATTYLSRRLAACLVMRAVSTQRPNFSVVDTLRVAGEWLGRVYEAHLLHWNLFSTSVFSASDTRKGCRRR